MNKNRITSKKDLKYQNKKIFEHVRNMNLPPLNYLIFLKPN